MRGACIAFVAGAWLLQQQAELFEGTIALAAAAVALLTALLATSLASRRNRRTGATPSAATGVDTGSVSGSGISRGSGTGTKVDIDPAAAATVPAPNEAIEGSSSKAARSMRSIAVDLCVRAVVVAAAFVIGFAWSTWRADRRLADALPHALENRDIVVVGTVAALPGLDPRGIRFPFAVESVVSVDDRGVPLRVPSHLSLGWYRPGHGFSGGDGTVPDVRPGQRWRLTVRLKRPHGSANPFGFDYEFWLLEDGSRATGSVRPGADEDAGVDGNDDDSADVPQTATRKLSDFVWSIDNVIERTRAHLRDRVLTVLADGKPIEQAPYAGVIVALIVGDQRAIPQSDWTVFNRTGIGHLVSISGLHVSMLAALGAWLVFGLWRRRPAWCARLPAHKAAALAGTMVAFAYCLLAGWGVPSQRTLYMIGVVALALWLDRLSSVSRVLCTALVVVVALDPWAVMGSGFWLSFAAVASIFYVTSGRLAFVTPADPRRRRILHSIRVAITVQWAVTLALTPLTLLFFYQVSIISPVANAIAIPLVSFVVTPLSLAGAVLPGFVGAWLLYAAHGIVALLVLWLQWLSGSSIAVWTGAAPGWAAFVGAMVGVVWWLAPRGIALRWAGALWMVPLFAWPPDRPDLDTVRFTALDIGQGMAVLIETRDTNTLFDTGPVYSPPGNDSSNDAGSRIIVPYLRARGIARLDTMIVSHNDNDHSGGALSVLRAMPVVQVRSSLELDTPIVRESPRHERCRPGRTWTADGVRFDLLAPSVDVYERREGKGMQKANARSCVLRVEAHGHVMLLTADIEKPQEAMLVERYRAEIAADAMLVPHHGSRTSSSDAFLDAVHPSIAIVQAGYLNRFGHPRPDVLARYAVRRIDVPRNDRDGAVTVTMSASGIAVERYRSVHPRYWYDR